MSESRKFLNKANGKDFTRALKFLKTSCSGTYNPSTKVWTIDMKNWPSWAGDVEEASGWGLVEVKK